MEDNKIKKEINNVVNDNLKALEQLFPSAVKDGQLDIKALKEELGEFEEVTAERYELNWSGKQNAKKMVQQGIGNRTLKFVEKDSKNADTTENIYIEGDNLEVLKLLRQNYYNSIKMIYIDPPYNTGNDFVYNDIFKKDSDESDKEEGYKDETGKRLERNLKSTNRYHAKWLNMMYPRLKLARDLLADDGVIFISIDDNEQANLKRLCDEIFGEENFVGSFPRVTKKSGKSSDTIAKNHDYILMFSKNSNLKLNPPKHNDEGYSNTDEFFEERGYFKLNQTLDYDSLGYVKTLDYPIEIDGEIFYAGGSEEEYQKRQNGKHNRADWGWRWRWSKDLYTFGKDNGFIVVKKSKNGSRIYTKTYQNVTIEKINNQYEIVKIERTKPLSTLEYVNNIYSNDNAKKIFDKLMGKGIFEYTKTPILLEELTKLGTDRKSVILDFFSGSATTAHAVMQLNSEDNGNRKYIMVQLPETTDEKSEAFKAGYKNIAEIGKERIRRAGEKIKQEAEEYNSKLKLGEEPKKVPDIGFKVFKVDDTNIKWHDMENLNENNQYSFDDPDSLDFVAGSNDIDIVYEIMLRQNDVPLSESLEVLMDIGNRTYLYASSYLICLETEITEEMVEKLASLEPLPIKFVFRDSAFKDNISLKDETFRRLRSLIERNSGESKVSYRVEFI